jgi:hypothetical protein
LIKEATGITPVASFDYNGGYVMMRRVIFLLFAPLTLFLFACNASTPPTVDAPPTPVELTNGGAYPAPDLTTDQGYPSPAAEAEQFNELSPYQPPQAVIADSDKGAVIGRLVSRQLGVPIANVRVYLGENTRLNGGSGSVVTMQEQSSFYAETDGAGYFVINSVAPDSYGIIIFSPIEAKLLSDGAGGTLYIDVQAGQITDLEDLSITFP